MSSWCQECINNGVTTSFYYIWGVEKYPNFEALAPVNQHGRQGFELKLLRWSSTQVTILITPLIDTLLL